MFVTKYNLVVCVCALYVILQLGKILFKKTAKDKITLFFKWLFLCNQKTRERESEYVCV